MYKVFFNDRLVLLSNRELNKEKYELDAQLAYTDFEVLRNFVNDFLNKESFKCVNIYSSNLEELFFTFSKVFKCIDAAGGAVFNSNNELLVINRLNKWDLPKGKVEKGEDIQAAALREVEEECGITKHSIVDKLNCTYHIYYLKGVFILKTTHWYKMLYLGSEILIPQGEEDITQACWFGKLNMNEVLKNTYANIKLVIEQVF